MKEVNKNEFFRAIDALGKKGFDPMPQIVGKNASGGYISDWVCQKTRRLFGKTETLSKAPLRESYQLADCAITGN